MIATDVALSAYAVDMDGDGDDDLCERGVAGVYCAMADPSLPAGGRRLELHHAYLAAAVHAWLSPPPRGVGIWWDLERIAFE